VGRRAKAAIANPFYALLVLVGIAFVITACAYGVMTLRAVAPHAHAADGGNHPLLKFLQTHGSQLLLGEIVVLAIATFAAMGTDDFWTRRSSRRMPGADSEPGEKPTSGD
jgi:hypothetical protein